MLFGACIARGHASSRRHPALLSAAAMASYESDLLRVLDERGYIHQLTDAAGLDALAARQIVPGYIGFDATAPSLHIGSLVQIMMLRRLQQTGHKPVVVMGGGTTRIGDPSHGIQQIADHWRWTDRCSDGQ